MSQKMLKQKQYKNYTIWSRSKLVLKFKMFLYFLEIYLSNPLTNSRLNLELTCNRCIGISLGDAQDIF